MLLSENEMPDIDTCVKLNALLPSDRGIKKVQKNKCH